MQGIGVIDPNIAQMAGQVAAIGSAFLPGSQFLDAGGNAVPQYGPAPQYVQGQLPTQYAADGYPVSGGMQTFSNALPDGDGVKIEISLG